jgi:hypothetical protein
LRTGEIEMFDGGEDDLVGALVVPSAAAGRGPCQRAVGPHHQLLVSSVVTR